MLCLSPLLGCAVSPEYLRRPLQNFVPAASLLLAHVPDCRWVTPTGTAPRGSMEPEKISVPLGTKQLGLRTARQLLEIDQYSQGSNRIGWDLGDENAALLTITVV